MSEAPTIPGPDPRAGQASSYLRYLPAVFQEDAEPGEPNFLGRFLLAFEQILTGLGQVNAPGLEEILDGIVDPVSGIVLLDGVQRYFKPGPNLPPERRAPAEFLQWLAGWVALSLRADLDELRQREFIAQAVSLYHLRGTKKGLEDLVSIYTRLAVTIDELGTSFQLGVRSRIGTDTLLGGGAPHYFRVLIRIPPPPRGVELAEQLRRYRQVVSAIIDLEKPAHTFYDLQTQTPTLQIGVTSQIGVNTLLGSR